MTEVSRYGWGFCRKLERRVRIPNLRGEDRLGKQGGDEFSLSLDVDSYRRLSFRQRFGFVLGVSVCRPCVIDTS